MRNQALSTRLMRSTVADMIGLLRVSGV
jgi:hypothetical protein